MRVTRLRLFTSLLGGGLIVLSLWASTEYGPSQGIRPFAEVLLLGVFVSILPLLYIHGRRLLSISKFRLRQWRNPGDSDDGNIFVSTSPIALDGNSLDTIHEKLQGNDAYEEVYRTEFSAGDGLAIIHTGFHKSYIRITESGKLVLTGTTEHTRELARTLEDICSTNIQPSIIDPFTTPSIRKASRVILVVLTVVLILVGTTAVAGAAYPSTAYNPAERTVLVGIDAHSDINPSVSTSDTSITKAEFLIQVLDEEAIEIHWEDNTTSRIRAHGRDALLISSDARKHLLHAKACGYSDERKLSQLESDLADAERGVADAIDTKSASLSNDDPYLDHVQKQLLERGRQPSENRSDSLSTTDRTLNASCPT